MSSDPLGKVTPGQPFEPKAAAWNAFVDAAKAHRGGNLGFTVPPLQPSAKFFPARVTAIHNDWLEVRRIDKDGTAFGPTLEVAKPPELRHDVGIYVLPGGSTLTTNDAQEVEVTGGAITETWRVTPEYKINQNIVVFPITGALGGENDADPPEPLRLIDANIAGRAWAVVDDEEPE